MDDSMAVMDPSFDPRFQPVTLFYPDGTNVSFSVNDITTVHVQNIQQAVVFATQIGACGIIAILMLLLTRSEKRKTFLFGCNLAALLTVVIRSVFQISNLIGPWNETYTFFAYDYSDISLSARYESIAGAVFALLLQMLVQLSLILQVRVVFAGNAHLNLAITLLTTFISLLSVGFYFVVVVENARAMMVMGVYSIGWVYATAKASFAASISIFSLIFVLKLGLAIRKRRILGLKSFGPMQIIFAMGCQTMVLPAVFAILENVVEFGGLGSLSPTLVAITLPLSAMWAGARLDNPTPTTTVGHGEYKLGFISHEYSSSDSRTNINSPNSWQDPRTSRRGWRQTLHPHELDTSQTIELKGQDSYDTETSPRELQTSRFSKA